VCESQASHVSHAHRHPPPQVPGRPSPRGSLVFVGLGKPTLPLSPDLVINTLDGFYWNQAGRAHDLLFN
jgi:hypothetical protein